MGVGVKLGRSRKTFTATARSNMDEWAPASDLMTRGLRLPATSPRIVPPRDHGLVMSMGDEELSTANPKLRNTHTHTHSWWAS